MYSKKQNYKKTSNALTKSTKSASSRPYNPGKYNIFYEKIQEIAKECEFDPTHIILCFKNANISSSDFSLHRFQDRRAFIVEFCQNEYNISITKGNLIKLWKSLNRKYNLSLNRPCRDISINPSIFSTKSLVYIPPKCTQQIIESELIQESIFSANRLYQYLNWTIRINKINKFMKIYNTSNGIEMMVINSELHDKYGDILYILCIKNDIISSKSQKWQFVKLQTAQEIMELATTEFSTQKKELLVAGYIRNIYDDDIGSVSNACSVCSVCSVSSISDIISSIAGYGCIGYMDSINSVELPLGARYNAPQFAAIRSNKLVSKQCIRNKHYSRNKYRQLKGIRTGYDKRSGTNKDNVLQISLSEFHQYINHSLKSNDLKYGLIPIVTMLTGKQYGFGGQYHIDELLPVYINGDWIGIVYRDGLPVMTLIDGYDITNKAILCNPSFDPSKLEWFTNNINKIEIGSSRVNKKRYYEPQQNHNNNNNNMDNHGFYDEFNNNFDDKSNNNIYTEGYMDTISIGNNTTNYVDVASEEAMMEINNTTNCNPAVPTDGYQQYQTTTTAVSGICGNYQFIEEQDVYPSVATATATSTNLILSQQQQHQQEPIALEGMQHITNTIQFHQQQALYFGQFSNFNVSTITNVHQSQSQHYLNNNVLLY